MIVEYCVYFQVFDILFSLLFLTCSMTHLKEMGEIQCCKSLQLFINLSTISFVQNGFQFSGNPALRCFRSSRFWRKLELQLPGVIDSHHISKFYQLSLSQDFSHHCTCDSYGMALDKLISNLQIT